jgi:predicted GIY-YIG superfamily endonuclease
LGRTVSFTCFAVAWTARYYTGVTSNVARRLEVHNSGGLAYTTSLRRWTLVVALEFASDQSASSFDRYLKSGSGRAFAKKDFV